MKNFFRKLKKKVLIFIFPFLQIFFKKNTYLLIDDLFEEDAECIDTYSLFCYMQNKGIPSYYVIWNKNYFYQKLKNSDNLKHVIVLKERFGTDFIQRSFWILLKTKVIVSGFLNWGNYTPERKLVQDFVNSSKSFIHVYLNHGVTFFKKDILRDYSPNNFKKLIVSNDYEKEIYMNKANWLEKDLIKGGLTRWDLLEKKEHKERNIFVFFTFRKSLGKNKNYQDFEYYKRIISLFNNKQLCYLLQNYHIKLIYGIHHALRNQVGLDWNIQNPNIEVADIHNISKYISQTDLFITDYSSLVFDFMFLNIPVIFYKLDFNDTRLLEQDRISVNSFNECEPFIYNVCDSEENLIQKISDYIQNDFLQSFEHYKKNEKFFYYKNNIAELVTAELEKL